MQFCGQWITHKIGIQIHLGQVLKFVGNISYHFLFAVSFGNKASKMSGKFMLDRKICFQNTFYIKRINVIIDSIGSSIILRSIHCFLDAQWQLTGIWLKFKLIQAFIITLAICKNEEDQCHNEDTIVVTNFCHYKSMGFFSDTQW